VIAAMADPQSNRKDRDDRGNSLTPIRAPNCQAHVVVG